jgi:hypothetical protein
MALIGTGAACLLVMAIHLASGATATAQTVSAQNSAASTPTSVASAAKPIAEPPYLKGYREWVWTEQPWPIRYFLLVKVLDGDDAWVWTQEGAHRRNSKNGIYGHEAEEFFVPTLIQPIDYSRSTMGAGYGLKLGEYGRRLYVTPIEFDRFGWVISPHSHPQRLRGHFNKRMDLVLSVNDDPTQPAYILGGYRKSFKGFAKAHEHITPALCDGTDLGSTEERNPESRYGLRSGHGWFFGCREWAYQMHKKDRPYIDATGYPGPIPKSDAPLFPRIETFIGWGQFDQPAKPVIAREDSIDGKQAYWYCLYDCPADQSPGPIADIKVWSKALGFKPPVRPKKVPQFPDKDFILAPDEEMD